MKKYLLTAVVAAGCGMGAASVLAQTNLAARLDVIEFSSRTLKDNPLGDPVVRRVAVFVPGQYRAGQPLPIVYYLPGYGSSSEPFIHDQAHWLKFTQKLASEVTPMLLVVVDGRTRWGGSQYLNSPAQGNYAAYVCDEIVQQVESRYPAASTSPRRIVAGHSSGGFGALRLGMMHPKLFDGVIALSPDADFVVTQLPLANLPGVKNISLAQIEALMISPPGTPLPGDGDLVYAIGLSAAYAPRGPTHPGQFDWLYDAQGHFREEVAQRWIDNDPLTMAQKDPNAFQNGQSIYLEGAAQDDFQANIGARAVYDVLKTRPARCTFYEPPGHHSDHVPERLERGLAWVFGRSMRDIH